MIAVLVNALAIIVGSLAGVGIRKGLSKRYEHAIFSAAGVVTLVIGMQMAFQSTHILAFALCLIVGGLVGTLLDIEGRVLGFGERLRGRFVRGGSGAEFASGFLNASVLFCSGAMAIVGSFKAGTEGDYSIIFTKSILDGFISVMFAGTMGIGVAFSALSVLVYQGALTLGSIWVKSLVTPLMLAELTGVGGALVFMIGLGLLDIRKCRTGDFLPALVLMVLAVLAMPFVPML
jgi:uncharacterized protein